MLFLLLRFFRFVIICFLDISFWHFLFRFLFRFPFSVTTSTVIFIKNASVFLPYRRTCLRSFFKTNIYSSFLLALWSDRFCRRDGRLASAARERIESELQCSACRWDRYIQACSFLLNTIACVVAVFIAVLLIGFLVLAAVAAALLFWRWDHGPIVGFYCTASDIYFTWIAIERTNKRTSERNVNSDDGRRSASTMLPATLLPASRCNSRLLWREDGLLFRMVGVLRVSLWYYTPPPPILHMPDLSVSDETLGSRHSTQHHKTNGSD